jgi:hypothetical protein
MLIREFVEEKGWQKISILQPYIFQQCNWKIHRKNSRPKRILKGSLNIAEFNSADDYKNKCTTY